MDFAGVSGNDTQGGVPASVHKAGGLAPLSTGSCDSTYTSRSGTRGIRPTKKCSNVIIEEAGVQFLFSTRKGVYYDKRRRLWRANWKEDGRIHTKGFSLNGAMEKSFTLVYIACIVAASGAHWSFTVFVLRVAVVGVFQCFRV